MSDKMYTLSFPYLLNWILKEFKQQKTIFNIPQSNFYCGERNSVKLFGDKIETPLGPAAGPHTQMAQNIISAYLTGGRFIELKTIQKLDQLEIDKPCIDANDEGYNVEWSQELLLDEAYDEYVKAWLIIHLLKELLTISTNNERGFIFNMSVGYDLAGIKTDRMNRFIDETVDANKNPLLNRYKTELISTLKEEKFADGFPTELKVKERINNIIEKIENISPNISNSVTLSTMHGCPPKEIEAIANYLLEEKKVHTYVKLNPTLLGYQTVSEILRNLGYKYIKLKEESFSHDLQYDDAVPMIKRLKEVANKNGLVFGVKLSNTLGVTNNLKVLAGDEMYMSGRALFPLTINLADKIAIELNGEINISYSGGANVDNANDILNCGIYPITMATELLKPGGYTRIYQIANQIELQKSNDGKVHLAKLNELAKNSLTDPNYKKTKKEIDTIKIDQPLESFDCYIAPCQAACPIHQDVAEYIKLVKDGKYEEAFEVIVTKNPLPHITGYICDHKCMSHCTRWDYDEPLLIRDIKKEAAEKGYSAYIENHKDEFKFKPNNIKVAVIGAGPSGLSSAYFLAKGGFDVTIYDTAESAGGVVQNILPRFRIPAEAIQKDISFIEMHGIKFEFNADYNFSVDKLKADGYKYIYISIGAGKSNKLDLGDEANVIDAIEFLKDFHADKQIILGENVAIIGGGNSAMDGARAAMRIDGVRNVSIVYRRTEEFMPADKEEFFAALDDGVVFNELLNPVKLEDGILTCQKMVLGEVGKDGRRKVSPIENEFVEMKIDTVITAIGEYVDDELLKSNGIDLTDKGKVKVGEGNETSVENVFIGGDSLRGPSTVVESIADARIAAESIIKKEDGEYLSINVSEKFNNENWISELKSFRGEVKHQNKDDISEETTRCLGCDVLCNKCVDVCPNRANIPIASNGIFKNNFQILHLDDLCNECGNCETFCPHTGAPYKDKITLFANEERFIDSKNEGFFFNDGCDFVTIRFNNTVEKFKTDTLPDKNKPALEKLSRLIISVKENYSYLISD